jgi:hypothetical protein
VALTVFERRGRDLIDFVLAPGDTHFRAVNLRRVTTDGVEVVASHRFAAAGAAGGGPARSTTLTASWAWLDSSGDRPPGISSYVFDYLEHRVLLRGEGVGPWRLGWGTSLSWNARLDDDPYWKLDARLSRAVGRSPVRLYVEGTNLTGARYHEQGEVEMPGRWLVAGAQWTGKRVGK